MKRHAAYRIEADLCFYFSILSIFPAFRPWTLPMALFAGACFVVSLVAVHVRQWPLRLLLALLPGLCFLGAELKFLLFFPALGWLYVILMLTAGRFHIWLDEYRRIYRAMLIICLCSIAANVAHATIYSGAVISYVSLAYALCFLCLGVIAMRCMQMNADMSLRWRLANAFTVAGVPVLAVGGSLLIYLLLRYVLPGVNYIFRPIGEFVDRVLLSLFPAYTAAPAATLRPMPTTPPMAVDMDPAAEGRSLLEDIPDHALASQHHIERVTAIGGYVVLGILLILAIWLVVRYAGRSRKSQMQDTYTYEETEEDLPQPKKPRGGRRLIPTPADQVRAAYRKYLELMRENGVSIRRDSTSEEILDEAEQIQSSPAARRLRELYLKVRYGETSVTREDAQEAAACLKELREQEGWRT